MADGQRIRTRLNQRVADGALPSRGEKEIWDTDLPGFVLRVRAKSASWLMRGRLGDAQKTYTIGRSDDRTHPEYLRADAARKKAEEVRIKLRRGEDPFPRGDEGKELVPPPPKPTVEEERVPTFREASEKFLERLKRRGKYKSAEIYKSVLLNIQEGEHLRDKPFPEVTARDIQRFRDNLFNAEKYVQSNRCMTICSSLYRWALTEPSMCVSVNVAFGIGHVSPPEQPRKRNLSLDEVRRLLEAVDAEKRLSDPVRFSLWLCLLTGQRKLTVTRAEKAEFDLEARLWTIPADKMKMSKTHAVPLPELAMRVVIHAMKKSASEQWLFPSKTHPHLPTHHSALIRMLLRLRQNGKLDGIPDFTIHDLRRTLVSRLREKRVPKSSVAALMAHDSGDKTGNVTQRVYDQSQNLDEKLEAIEAWCSMVEPLRDWSDLG